METTNVSMRRSELAPLTLLIGDVALRILTYAEHLDFLLSVRDEKFATMLQFFRDSGWWIVAIASAIWFLYEWKWRKANAESTSSVGALVFSAGCVAFLLGVLVTVSATGSLPEIIQNYGGDAASQTCSSQVDTSRLIGFQDDYHLILLCGAQDPTIDLQEDTRIAISSVFNINGGPMNIVTPLGEIREVWKDQLPSLPAGKGISFSMWHTIAIIPKDIDQGTIKRASDVVKIGGRILTLPIGGNGSPMVVISSAPIPVAPPSSPKAKKI